MKLSGPQLENEVYRLVVAAADNQLTAVYEERRVYHRVREAAFREVLTLMGAKQP